MDSLKQDAPTRDVHREIREELQEVIRLMVYAPLDERLNLAKRFAGDFTKWPVQKSPSGILMFEGQPFGEGEENSPESLRDDGHETDSPWSLRDEGRSDGYGESYGERNT